MILPVDTKSRASLYGASLMLGEFIAHLLIVEGDRAISIIVRSLALFWSVALVHPLAVPVLPRGRVGPRSGPGEPGRRLGYPPRRRGATSSVGERGKTGPWSRNACKK